jgi:transcriptional regulator with PAS, ATPase and Fis domain
MFPDVTRAATRAQVVKYTKTRIVVVAGPDLGQKLEIAGKSVSIGTSPDSDLVLHDDTVSRKHCEIEVSGDGVRVRDIGSRNGVFVAGVRVYDALLSATATLCLGNTQLGITPLDETVERLQATTDRFGDVLGASSRMRELFADLDQIASTELTLLIEGETGTGKDVIAESIHRASARADGPFVVFDCGAVAPNLAESELFGHERGAFTGAVMARAGVFEEARGGTLFLDEIGELPKDLQPKLLRVLEKREIRRLGGARVTSVDVRIVAATNRNMTTEVRRGLFREDLYFRLAATHVIVPPLRERMSDLPLLVQHFLSLERPPRHIDEITPEVWQMLRAHRWPGNVRELRSAVQRLLVLRGRALDPGARPSPSEGPEEPVASVEHGPAPLRVARRDAGDEFERNYIGALLARTGGNVSRAANLAEVSRQMLQKIMRKHGIVAGLSPARSHAETVDPRTDDT